MIHSAVFIKSAPSLSECPGSDLPEFAFIGRSNVGKSSLVNMLASRKDLAKTSASPGKTRLINFFLINGTWHLVDLPGYGYARASKDMRRRFRKSVTDYILRRKSLCMVFVLVDSRLTPQAIDLEFINMLGAAEIPFGVIFTKTDKSNRREWHRNVETFRRAMHETWEELPPFFFSSAVSRAGKEEIIACIEEVISGDHGRDPR